VGQCDEMAPAIAQWLARGGGSRLPTTDATVAEFPRVGT
jgi:hypothetical protein